MTLARRTHVTELTLHDQLLALGYCHAPSAGDGFSRGIYAGARLVFLGNWQTVWGWLAETGQIEASSETAAWLATDGAAEAIAAGIETARMRREQQIEAARAAEGLHDGR